MKIEEVLREVAYPLTNLTVLFALLTFALLFALSDAAGIFGLYLGLVTLPAFFRYALYLLEARAQGQRASAPGIEAFGLLENFWALFPAVLPGVFIWLEWQIVTQYSLASAAWALLLFIVIYPSSMAVLAITRSPLASINPLAMWRFVRLCGRDYFWIPAAVTAVVAMLVGLAQVDTPFLLFDVAANYAFVLLFTLTGAVMHVHGAMQEVAIEPPVEPSASEVEADLMAARRKVASHAYGFISRDNRQGGFAHIRDWIEQEPQRDAAYRWFFDDMMRWENRLPAMFFAQDYLHQLLGWQMEREALKLISRCLHEDPHWLPATGDRPAVAALLDRQGRADLVRQMPSL